MHITLIKRYFLLNLLSSELYGANMFTSIAPGGRGEEVIRKEARLEIADSSGRRPGDRLAP